jgi:hypothetical protein
LKDTDCVQRKMGIAKLEVVDGLCKVVPASYKFITVGSARSAPSRLREIISIIDCKCLILILALALALNVNVKISFFMILCYTHRSLHITL